MKKTFNKIFKVSEIDHISYDAELTPIEQYKWYDEEFYTKTHKKLFKTVKEIFHIKPGFYSCNPKNSKNAYPIDTESYEYREVFFDFKEKRAYYKPWIRIYLKNGSDSLHYYDKSDDLINMVNNIKVKMLNIVDSTITLESYYYL